MTSAYALGTKKPVISDNRTFDVRAYTNAIAIERKAESGFERSMRHSPARYNSFSHDVAQNNNAEFKSRSEVMSQVKRRYDAKILKITLNKARGIYVIRLLMQNGKVKTVQVSARS